MGQGGPGGEGRGAPKGFAGGMRDQWKGVPAAKPGEGKGGARGREREREWVRGEKGGGGEGGAVGDEGRGGKVGIAA